MRHGKIGGDAGRPRAPGPTERSGVRLRRRVLISIVAVTAGAVLVFSVPLAWAVAQLYRGQAVATLQRDTTWAAANVGARSALDPAAVEGFDELSSGVDVGLYTPAGRKISGEGPPTSQLAGQAANGALHQAVEAGHLAVAAPVVSGGRVVATVRVWMPWDSVTDRWMQIWLLLAALGAAVVALAALVAWKLARRVATPLERLTVIARALGDGDFTIQAPHTGIREADVAGRALSATARRLGQVLERERSFSTAVSHQLRTPLTALVLGLEAAQTADENGRRQAVATALRRAEHLTESVEELLRLARETHRRDCAVDAAEVAERVAQRYRATVAESGRRLVVRCEPDLAPVRVSEAAIAQILSTLLDNALVHGRGEIRLTVSDMGAGVSMEVADDGPGLALDDERPADDGSGLVPGDERPVDGGPGVALDDERLVDDGSGLVSGDERSVDDGSAVVPGDERQVFGERPPDAARHGLAPRHGLGLQLARSLAEAEGGRLAVRRAGPRPVFSLLLPIQVRDQDASDPADADHPAHSLDVAEGGQGEDSQR